MFNFIRNKFQLTQDRLAAWLGLDRTMLAHVEAGRRDWPLSMGWLAMERLVLAARGEALLDNTTATAPPPPLPLPAVDRDPLQ
jgi:predicted transcriptional regulator